MKKEWYTLAGICSVVIGIVMFCVIMGGYTSLLRAKNRINAAKGMITDECRKQLELIPDLVSLARGTAAPELIDRIEKSTREIPSVLSDLTASEAPTESELMTAFETLLSRLSQDTTELFQAIKQPNERVTAYAEQVQKTAYIAKRYNKEAHYFNHRKTIFPGFIVAKIFNLEKLHFPEIAVAVFGTQQGSANS